MNAAPRTRAVALVLLAAPGVAAWAGLVAGFGARVAVAIAAGVLIALTGGRRRAAVLTLAAWIVAAPLLAGVTDHDPAHLAAGLQSLTQVSAAPVGQVPWALAAALLLAGGAWIGAAALPPAPGLALAALPWGAALVLGPPSAAVWQGGAVVLGGLLWWAAPRATVTAAVALSAAVALASTAAAQGIGPHHRWLRLPRTLDHSHPSFRTLSTEPTYGPLGDRRSGATMLEVDSRRPLLWRMQPLNLFDGVTWRAARGFAALPEPKAQPAPIVVHVRGLRDDLAVSPGRVESISAPGAAKPIGGEAWSISPLPGPGATYRVDADAVEADAATLRRAPNPTDPRLLAYTRIGGEASVVILGPLSIPIRLPRPLDIPTPLWGEPHSAAAKAAADASPYARVAALARRLAAGAPTQYDVVQRVERHLLGGGRFRYTTDVGRPGPLPLADFLLRTHAGYCQHFAGAAALLLRLAGVPARVVAGFATGVARGRGYEVRDLDAHDWIEVYFAGVGWVPFNPTPPADPAAVPSEFGGGPRHARADGPPLVLAALVLATLAAARRPRRRDPAERLARLLGAGPQATLAELQRDLAARVGPHTAGLARELQDQRFARVKPSRGQRSLARALARDAGPLQAARLLIRSAR
ncbi:transglutaminase-like domain-containing protein [Candidatus Solirubrobacter pratensis]|uniref:transglutaminase-like domain-containing protein n=1 Tax=Candidatus Solirubrobacter pratensis TaxID=1298857 RepID=UPI00041EBEC2|nr:transglutaminase-like domain-containing protein [Candidatus Solirubrobacter pratensis]